MIQWGKALVVGVVSAAMMMLFVDIFAMMGIIPFTYETYIGSLARGTVEIATLNWLVGYFINLGLGALFGIFYAIVFESFFAKANARIGLLVSMGHSVVAALLFFPFFNMAHAEIATGWLPEGGGGFAASFGFGAFGVLGSGLTLAMPPVLIVGHALFGASMGALYGRLDEDTEIITAEDDPEDRVMESAA